MELMRESEYGEGAAESPVVPVLEMETMMDIANEVIMENTEEGLSSTANTSNTPAKLVEKLTRIPRSRIRNLVKLDPDVGIASQEAVFLISKATELFIDAIAKEAYSFTVQSKKKTLQKKDVDSTIESIDALAFLEGTLD